MRIFSKSILFVGIWLTITTNVPAGEAKLLFNRDIRPILSENCFACHGPDKGHRKGKLRLDVREEALAKEAFKPGAPDQSELVKRIFAADPDDVMPPADSRKKLTPAQRETLKKWIAQGAEYQPHWAYINPERAAAPEVKHRKLVVNPIDAFVLQQLEERKLEPAPQAEKATLLRRLSLDLIGLPPTPAEVQAFVKSKDSKAYKKEVDRLLRSPHYGERMAVPWLDVVRFSDTVGYHGDQGLNDFPYRDYVIDSFNRNKPFDQFTIEQLAGDLLPNPTPEQLVATGFNRLNMVTREGGAQPKEYLAKYGADRVRTVSMAWLGSTMGCAECHDHKFDPFSAKDFYAMKAFFADVKEWGVYQDYAYTPNPDLKNWSNDHPFPPEIAVENAALKKRMTGIRERIVRTANNLLADPKLNRAFATWISESRDFLKTSTNGWRILNAEGATNYVARPDGSLQFNGSSADRVLSFELPAGRFAAARLELLPSEQNGNKIVVGKAATTTINFSARVKSGSEEKPVRLLHADADHKTERYFNGSAIIGVKDAWRTSPEFNSAPQTAVWLFESPVNAKAGDRLMVRVGKGAVGALRVSLTPFADLDPLRSGAETKLASALQSSGRSSELVKASWLMSAAPNEEAAAAYKKLQRQYADCGSGMAQTVVTVSREPLVTRVLSRGNWLDETGAIVQPAAPHFLTQIKCSPETKRPTRLDLARWLVSRDNPLTARTVVNRFWKQFFGAGLSPVVDDLGAQGESPTHPELLDWLAVEFMESGWNVKHLVKLIVMSNTYRQSSNPRPEIKEIDPANQLLASQSPRRLEAEFVRDNALFVAGLLNEEVGGPSAHPYQPAGYYANLQFPDRDYMPDLNDIQYRRGVYTHWQRTFLHPMLANFDAPGREECIAARTISNSPQQALTLLNDPTFVEAARVMAVRLLDEGKNDEERLRNAYQIVLARSPKPGEMAGLKSVLAGQREHYKADQKEASKLQKVGLAKPRTTQPAAEIAAWTQVCRVILNLHETITRY